MAVSFPPPSSSAEYTLGVGSDYEVECLTDCDYSPTYLKNLVARANGQDMFKDAKPHERRSNLGYVVGTHFSNIQPLYLHNAGNDSYWEVWSTLKAIQQGLGLVNSLSADQRSARHVWIDLRDPFVKDELIKAERDWVVKRARDKCASVTTTTPERGVRARPKVDPEDKKIFLALEGKYSRGGLLPDRIALEQERSERQEYRRLRFEERIKEQEKTGGMTLHS